MASTITPQIFVDGSRNTVIKYLLECEADIGSPVFNGVGLNDLSVSGAYTDSIERTYKIEIDGTGTPDTFRWSDDNGATWTVSTVNITGAAQLLNYGISITFGATTGHTLNDAWTIAITINFTKAVLYDTSSSDSQSTSNKIRRIDYQFNGFSGILYWDATTDVPIITLDQDLQETVDYSEYGGLINNGGAGQTGDILITTENAIVGSNGYIILYLNQRGA